MSVLVLRTPCEHGEIAKHPLWCSDLDEAHDHQQLVDGCPGGSEVVLDPTTVVEILTRELYRLYRLHRDRDIDLAHDYRADARPLAEALVRALQRDS